MLIPLLAIPVRGHTLLILLPEQSEVIIGIFIQSLLLLVEASLIFIHVVLLDIGLYVLPIFWECVFVFYPSHDLRFQLGMPVRSFDIV